MDNNTNHQQPTDKQAYLDSIAVKTKATTAPSAIHIPPFAIKLIAVGCVVLLAMLAVTGLLNQNKQKLQDSYSELALSISTLSGQTSPLEQYKDKIKSSDLRFQTTSLLTTLQHLNVQLTNAMPNVGVNPKDHSNKATETITAQINSFTASCEAGYYNGHFDTSYANAVALQLSQIIALESQIRSKTSDSTIAGIIDESLPALTEFQTVFQNFADTL